MRWYGLCLAGVLALPVCAQADDVQDEMKRLSDRVKALEERNQALEKAMASEYQRESDPEVATRIKVLESQTGEMREKKHILDALSGIQVGGNLVMVGQSAPSRATLNGAHADELTWRGDLTVEMPAGESGNTTGKLFTHIRVGQGNGLSPLLKPTYTGNVNSSTFALGGSTDASDSSALLAQLWYQLDFGIPNENQDLTRKVELTFGKMDPFLFFDQNAAADDETSKFLNNVFVHGAQLDSGGDVGVDSYGFSPGLRMAYRDESEGSQYWQLSAGLFGSGYGSTYSSSFNKPFVIAQAERGMRLFNGQEGTYRVYAWRNGRGTDFDEQESEHSGWGLSFDQRLPGGWLAFTRYGQELSGKVTFDQSFSVGASLSGNAWSRGADELGMAVGFLRTSSDWKKQSLAIAGYQADSTETNLEVYYRFYVNSAFELTPDVQYIQNPGGNSSASDFFTVGLRAKASF